MIKYSTFSQHFHNAPLIYCLEKTVKHVDEIIDDVTKKKMFSEADYTAEQKRVAAIEGVPEDAVFCYGNTETRKIISFTIHQTEEEIFTILAKDRTVSYSAVAGGLWEIVYQRMGYSLGRRPLIQDTRKDIIKTLCDVLKEVYRKPYLPLYRDEVGDLIKIVVKNGLFTYHKDQRLGKSDIQFSESDIGLLLAESGLVCIRTEQSDLPEKDILLYQPPDSRYSTEVTSYTWAPLPKKIDKSGENTTGLYQHIAEMYNEKVNTDRIVKYLYKAPRVKHTFSRVTIFCKNGVVVLGNNGKSGRLLTWEEVERDHFMEAAFMPISFKLNIDFPVENWDEKDPILEQPVIQLPAEGKLPPRTMTPLQFVSEIFDPEEEWGNYDNGTATGLEISERVYGFLLFFRTFLQPYAKWERMLFLVDSSGIATGGNAKNSILKFLSFMLTWNVSPPPGGTIVAADLETLTSKNSVFKLSRFNSITHLWFSSENTNKFLDNLEIIKALVTGDTVPKEEKYDTPGNGRYIMSMVHCFNSLPNFSSVEFSFMRRLEVLYTPNSFVKTGKARIKVDEDFIENTAVVSWLAYYVLRKFGSLEKIPTDLPLFMRNKAVFTQSISRVQQFIKEIMEDNPHYLCNDVYRIEDLYIVFKKWYKTNIREKGDPPSYDQFLKQAADYIEQYVTEWSILVPKKGEKRVQKKVSVKATLDAPENFVYEYRQIFAENTDPYFSFRPEAIKRATLYGGLEIDIGRKTATRADVVKYWEYLKEENIADLCKLETRFKHGKQADKIVYRNNDYLGTGKFLHCGEAAVKTASYYTKEYLYGLKTDKEVG